MELQTTILKKFHNELIVALALILLGAGIGYDTTNDETYNPYESRVVEIDGMMQKILDNPTEDNLVNAQQALFYNYYPWVERQTAVTKEGIVEKENFIAYLEACNQVIIQMSKGLDPDTSEMEKLKKEFISS